MRTLLALALCSVAAVSTAAAQTTSGATAAAQTVAGTWDASYNTPGGPRSFTLVLTVDGTKLGGTVKREAGDSQLTGTVKGDSVAFSYSIDYNGHALEMTITAAVTGQAMKGIVDFGGQGQDEFQAKRVAGPEKKPAGSSLATTAGGRDIVVTRRHAAQ